MNESEYDHGQNHLINNGESRSGYHAEGQPGTVQRAGKQCQVASSIFKFSLVALYFYFLDAIFLIFKINLTVTKTLVAQIFRVDADLRITSHDFLTIMFNMNSLEI